MMVLVPIYVFVCIALILIVLIQPGKEESLGTIMGGAAAQNLFGSRTTSVLAKITTVLASIYLVVAILMAGMMDARKGVSKTIQALQDEVKSMQTLEEKASMEDPFDVVGQVLPSDAVEETMDEDDLDSKIPLNGSSESNALSDIDESWIDQVSMDEEPALFNAQISEDPGTDSEDAFSGDVDR